MQKVFRLLAKFEVYSNMELFQSIFNAQAIHLWNQFRFKHNGSITSFYQSLDISNQARLITYLNRDLGNPTS
jgi:hypothetical protein